MTAKSGRHHAGGARSTHAARVVLHPLETDGRLPSGDTLAHAIERVERESDAHPAYYMINCAHPTHFEHVLSSLGSLHRQRVRGLAL